jgi:GWxTD domain-containing protein
LLLLFGVSAYAQRLGIDISYAQFLGSGNLMEFHTYYAINGSTLRYKQIDKGAFKGGIIVNLNLVKDGTIKVADRFRILSPTTADSVSMHQMFIHKHSFDGLEAGDYTLQMSVTDINDSTEDYHFSESIKINPLHLEASTSDFVLVDNVNNLKAKAPTKSAGNITPIVSSGSYYLTQQYSTLTFYLELYNFKNALEPEEPYLLKYYIEDTRLSRPLSNYASFKKMEVSPTNILMASFNIKNLPTGNYNLVVEALSPKNDEILKRKLFFYRNNPGKRIDISEYKEEQLAGTFVRNYTNFDSMYAYVEYLYPISTDGERKAQETILESRNIKDMQRYFYAYWVEKNPLNPQGEWDKYHKEVNHVNRKYKTPIQKGYLSDRGRVYLVYGEPDLIYSRPFEPSLPPYEQWQYDRINTPYSVPQVNKQFVFVEFEISSNDYELIHSTALGELFNRRWQYELADGAFGNGNLDNNNIPISNQGSRINDQVIFGTSGAGRN